MGRMKAFFSRITTQLVLATSLSFLLMIAAVSAILYYQLHQSFQDKADSSTTQSFRQFEYNIMTFCDEVDLISTQLLSDKALNRLTASGIHSPRDRMSDTIQLLQQMNQICGDYDYIDSVAFYTAEDIALIAERSQNLVSSGRSQKASFFVETLGDLAHLQPMGLQWYVSTSSDFGIQPLSSYGELPPKSYLSAVRKIYSGGKAGVIIINIDSGYFTDIYNHIPARDGLMPNTYIVDRKNIVISHAKNEWIGQKRDIGDSVPGQEIHSYSDGETQVLVYPLQVAGWRLVSETPMAVVLADSTHIRNMIILIMLIGGGVTILLVVFWVYRITTPLTGLQKAMDSLGQGALGTVLKPERSYPGEISALVNRFNSMSANVLRLMNEVTDMGEEKRRMEVQNLRSQINPHFLYNTLNAIKWMALMGNNEQVAQSIATLSDLLHPIFKDNSVFWTLRQELEYLENYGKIMNYRLGGQLTLQVEIHAALQDRPVPKFILQPLVENAVTHGFGDKGRGTIQVGAETAGDYFCILVEDDGDGVSDAALERLGKLHIADNQPGKVGLSNVHTRLQLLLGEDCGITLSAGQHGGFLVRVKLRTPV